VRQGVQQPARAGVAQRLQGQLRKTAVKTRGRHAAAHGDQQRDRLRVQPPGGEGERGERAVIQPLGVIGHDERRPVVRDGAQQGEHGHADQQRVGRDRFVRQGERAEQRLGLPLGQLGDAAEDRAQQLVEAGEGQVPL
jgi:hypothetical protein